MNVEAGQGALPCLSDTELCRYMVYTGCQYQINDLIYTKDILQTIGRYAAITRLLERVSSVVFTRGRHCLNINL